MRQSLAPLGPKTRDDQASVDSLGPSPYFNISNLYQTRVQIGERGFARQLPKAGPGPPRQDYLPPGHSWCNGGFMPQPADHLVRWLTDTPPHSPPLTHY